MSTTNEAHAAGTGPQEMAAFFDEDARQYDDITRAWDTEGYYERVAREIEPTDAPVTVLDLGIGTGYELPMIFARAPNARVTGVDLSDGMLEQLRRRHADRLPQIELVRGSLLALPFPPGAYDYVIAIATMHHFLEDVRLELYKKFRATLRDGGRYVEGDKVVAPEQEADRVARYHELRRRIAPGDDRLYHIDVPCAVETQVRLLRRASFEPVEVRYHDPARASAVVVGRAGG
ncbi:MAG TPA: class I SAM-dependent methyltransferase [Polyangiaceae bacterium]|nr:class I SAM-dependent methyltransferase [Polyangiaceae bacterium]